MRLVFLMLLLLCPALATAQGTATLVADNVRIIGQDRLVASGNIEVFYDGTSLRAQQIVFDNANDQLRMTGPIIIIAPDGTILSATQATLDPKLENGVLRSARMVLDRQLQLAANQIDRRQGRYSQLYKVAVTSCHVCSGEAPLWEIRANKVIHDQDERQLYFQGAQFRIRGVPVFYLPQMRLPDPTLARATGFLRPEPNSNNQLSYGIKIPYFIALGDDRDLTLTPYVSAETTTFEARYRQAFRNGLITLNTAVSNDTLHDGLRSYVFAEGRFDLARDYTLQFDIEAVGDESYLLDYGYSEKDRLDSAISLTKVTQDMLISADLTYYRSLRLNEVNAALPPLVGNLVFEQRKHLSPKDTLHWMISADTAYRYGTQNAASDRDVTRIGAQVDWSHHHVSQTGIVAKTTAQLNADWYNVQDDVSFDSTITRVTPALGITLRYPMAKTSAMGTRHLITPVAALAWSKTIGGTPPNEDSTRNAFDQSNLFDLSRFAGQDAVETGLRAALGLTWTRLAAQGSTSTLTFGRVLRDQQNSDFTASSGLDGLQSDWLVAGQLTHPNGFHLDARSLFDDQIDITRASARMGWNNENLDLAAAYIWQAKDPAQNQIDRISEWSFDTSIKLNPRWTISADTRYNLSRNTPVRAGVGVQYKSECVVVDFSMSRNYTSPAAVEPLTSYGLSVSLNGFSAGRSSARPNANCQ